MMKNCLYILSVFTLMTTASFAEEQPVKTLSVEQQEQIQKEVKQEEKLAALPEDSEEAEEEKLAVAPVSSKDIEDEDDEDEAQTEKLAAALAQSEATEESQEKSKEKSKTLFAGCANGKCPYSNINEDDTYGSYDGRSSATHPKKV